MCVRYTSYFGESPALPGGVGYIVNIVGSSNGGVVQIVVRLHVVEGIDLSSVGVQGGLGTKHISIFVYCAGERLKKERIQRIQQFLEKLSKENEEEAEDTVEEIFANLVRFIDSSQQTFQAGGLQPKKEEQTGTERQDSRRKSPGSGRNTQNRI